ncbi:MAG: hypothetical protein GXO82_08435, partial [Chlorobi bacterium]|nr:hypothetical protein [Chlorobiota bacterium]
MSARERFFSSLGAGKGEIPPVEEVRRILASKGGNDIPQQDLVQVFRERVIGAGGKVYQCDGNNEIPGILATVCREHGLERVVFADDLAESREKFQAEIESGERWHGETRLSSQVDRNYYQGRTMGITSARAAFADSGAVLAVAGANESRVVSLLPLVHVCLVDVNSIHPDLDDALSLVGDFLKGDGPSALTFIAGPSKTADIEKILVEG